MHNLVLSDRRNKRQQRSAGRVFLDRMAVVAVAVLMAAWANACGPGAASAAEVADGEPAVSEPSAYFALGACRSYDSRLPPAEVVGCGQGCPVDGGWKPGEPCTWCEWVRPYHYSDVREPRALAEPGEVGALIEGWPYQVTMIGRCGVPSTARAVSMNVTYIPVNRPGMVGIWARLVWPSRPDMEVYALSARRQGPRAAFAPAFALSAEGRIEFAGQADPGSEDADGAEDGFQTYHVLIDVTGYWE